MSYLSNWNSISESTLVLLFFFLCVDIVGKKETTVVHTLCMNKRKVLVICTQGQWEIFRIAQIWKRHLEVSGIVCLNRFTLVIFVALYSLQFVGSQSSVLNPVFWVSLFTFTNYKLWLGRRGVSLTFIQYLFISD